MYTIKHLTGFSQCSNDYPYCCASNPSKQEQYFKGLAEALTDLKNLNAFHQSVSVSEETALQHLADSLFDQLDILIQMHRDLDQQLLKHNTWNQLRNATLLGYRL